MANVMVVTRQNYVLITVSLHSSMFFKRKLPEISFLNSKLFCRLFEQNTDRFLSRNKLIPSPKSAKNLQIPQIQILAVEEIQKTTSSSPYLNEFRITLETDAVALYVWLETSEGKKIGIIYA